jgi:hypothetical protein
VGNRRHRGEASKGRQRTMVDWTAIHPRDFFEALEYHLRWPRRSFVGATCSSRTTNRPSSALASITLETITPLSDHHVVSLPDLQLIDPAKADGRGDPQATPLNGIRLIHCCKTPTGASQLQQVQRAPPRLKTFSGLRVRLEGGILV